MCSLLIAHAQISLHVIFAGRESPVKTRKLKHRKNLMTNLSITTHLFSHTQQYIVFAALTEHWALALYWRESDTSLLLFMYIHTLAGIARNMSCTLRY